MHLIAEYSISSECGQDQIQLGEPIFYQFIYSIKTFRSSDLYNVGNNYQNEVQHRFQLSFLFFKFCSMFVLLLHIAAQRSRVSLKSSGTIGSSICTLTIKFILVGSSKNWVLVSSDKEKSSIFKLFFDFNNISPISFQIFVLMSLKQGHELIMWLTDSYSLSHNLQCGDPSPVCSYLIPYVKRFPQSILRWGLNFCTSAVDLMSAIAGWCFPLRPVMSTWRNCMQLFSLARSRRYFS